MKKISLFFLLISISLFSAPYKVLHIASYSRTYSWVRNIEKGIKHALSSENIDYNYSIFQMNTKKYNSKEEILARAELAKNVILETDPDVVIISDDNAAKFVAAPMSDSNYKFVFCGVNNDPAAYGFPKKNITGVLERPHFRSTIKVLNLIDSNVKNIIILGDDSTTSNIINPYLEKTIDEELTLKVFKSFKTNSFEEWKKIVEKHQDPSKAFFITTYSTLKDSLGNPVSEKEVMTWTTKNSHIMEFGAYDFFIENGGLISVTVGGFEQGKLAAKKASKILKGTPAADIPIEATKKGELYLNAKRAYELKLNIPSHILEMFKIIE